MCYYSHIMLETYCAIDSEKSEVPEYCILESGKPEYHCYENECKYIYYTKAPNQISYMNEMGESIYDIGFGGEMYPEDFDETKTKELLKIWKNICKRKIDEAFEGYMKIKSKL